MLADRRSNTGTYNKPLKSIPPVQTHADEGKPLPFPPEPGNLGEILAIVLAVSPLQRDRYVRTLLDQVTRCPSECDRLLGDVCLVAWSGVSMLVYST